MHDSGKVDSAAMHDVGVEMVENGKPDYEYDAVPAFTAEEIEMEKR